MQAILPKINFVTLVNDDTQLSLFNTQDVNFNPDNYSLVLSANYGRLLNESLANKTTNTTVTGEKHFREGIYKINNSNWIDIYFIPSQLGYGLKRGAIGIYNNDNPTDLIIQPRLSFIQEPESVTEEIFELPLPTTEQNAIRVSTILTSNKAYNNACIDTQTFARTGITFTAYKFANWVQLAARGTLTSSISSGHTFGLLNEGFRPLRTFRTATTNRKTNACDSLEINSNGYLYIRNNVSSGNPEYMETMYFAAR